MKTDEVRHYLKTGKQIKNHGVCHELRFINEHEKASVTDFFIPEHRVCHELRFINEHEKASVTDFFIPGHREKITTLCALRVLSG